MNRYILSFSCDDRPGIVRAVSAWLFGLGGNILDSSQFGDPSSMRFFMRVRFEAPGGIAAVRAGFAALAGEFTMQGSVVEEDHRARVLILVSKFDHCLADLIYRQRLGELKMDVVAVAGNHPRAAITANIGDDLPFHHLPVTPETRPQQEAAIKALVEQTEAELVVLARYMQILSDDLAGYLAGRCINIHHSFLPGFKGAKPYHQAHARGVKMIGATAHYVTRDLDEGPIIHQDVEAISHADTPEDLIRKGRDIERRVLSRAVFHHLERRVLIDGGRTVVFRD